MGDLEREWYEREREGGGEKSKFSPCMSLSPPTAPRHWKPSTHAICICLIFSSTRPLPPGTYQVNYNAMPQSIIIIIAKLLREKTFDW